VVDKVNGGKADANNAALNIAKYPIVCVVDADSLLDPDALLRATQVFGADESVIAVGGTLRPLNGAIVDDGRVVDARAPATWVERFQVLEYTRAFFAYRAGWSSINCLMIISGGFGVFRRDALMAVGGWRPGYVADDMEMVVHLHRFFREQRRRYRIVFSPDPICWTEVPSTFKALRKQRDGWQRGLLEVLWHHRVMLGNPRYGRAGLLGIPFLWIFEAAAAETEALGYIVIVVTAVLGILNVAFTVLFLALALLFSVLLSQLAFGVETLLLERYPRVDDRLALFASAFVEFVGFHQVITFVRATSVFRVRSHHGKYWTTERAGLAAGDEGPAVVGQGRGTPEGGA
jgi:cellulose synthase/poly-beta-1,6-N-acetylglucosamine synthase-like glycosyltransferase